MVMVYHAVEGKKKTCPRTHDQRGSSGGSGGSSGSNDDGGCCGDGSE